MSSANIVVMGKTGAGKSTLINAVIGEDLAPTGIGGRTTQKNEIYTKTRLLRSDPQSDERLWAINLYDTVGLEVDNNITQQTLQEIKGYIKKTQQRSDDDDVNLVWFCVSRLSNRFEPYEVALIRDLVSEYEIPFVIVITQCFSDEKGELGQQIETEFPEFPIVRVLAKDYQTRVGIYPAFGVQELLWQSVFSYDELKIDILESKLANLAFLRESRLRSLTEKAKECIEKRTGSAMKIGFVPALSIPIVHGICIKTIADINKILGIKAADGDPVDIFSSAIVGIIATPFMAVPVLSGIVAAAYVGAVGETYLDAVQFVLGVSTDEELKDINTVSRRIREELSKKKKQAGDGLERTGNNLDQDEFLAANIIVTGMIGTGKSTLINAVFGQALEKIEDSAPISGEIQEIQEYRVLGEPICVWDTVGLDVESTRAEKTIKTICDTIAKREAVSNPFNRIHAIWYCIFSGSNKYQWAELQFIKTLHCTGVPVIIVLTRCVRGAADDDFRAEIQQVNESNGIGDIEIIQVTAKDVETRWGSIPSFGLDKLVRATAQILPEFIKSGFIASQRIDVVSKRVECEKIITDYVRQAKVGVVDKIPLANVFTTDKKIMQMLRQIGMIYNTTLPQESIERILKDNSINFSSNFSGLINPLHAKYKGNVTDFLKKVQEKDGFEVPEKTFKAFERAAQMTALYGYTFVIAIEDIWREFSGDTLKNANVASSALIERINKYIGEVEQRRNK